MESATAPRARSWPLYAAFAASLSVVVGLIWDISWHRTIGRDTFWSPPHVLEQLAALVAGLSCGYVVLHTTFRGSPAERARSVRFWGFNGPLGGWICIWGTLMMITSAPFDNWWHNAYGLDVKIISPPHMVLAWGMIAIQIGAIVSALARQNRASESERARLSLLYILSAGVLITMHATVLMEEAAFANHMHGARFYQLTAIAFPAFLVAFARPARLSWPATKAAALYLGVFLVMNWLLQLFPAQPMLAPIFNPVTHMVPSPFPLLLIVPAFAIDLILRRARVSDWTIAPMIGVAWVVLMVLVHWPLGEFLVSPYARNWFFGADQWDYNVNLGDWRYHFWTLDRDDAGNWSPAKFLAGIGLAMVIAGLSARWGLWLGKAMGRVQR